MKKIKGLAYITKEEVENGLEICSTQILHKINEFEQLDYKNFLHQSMHLKNTAETNKILR